MKVGAEVNFSGGLPEIVLVGLLRYDGAGIEGKNEGGVEECGLCFLPMHKIAINLTPTDLHKEGPSFDLLISVRILATSEQMSLQMPEDLCSWGKCRWMAVCARSTSNVSITRCEQITY